MSVPSSRSFSSVKPSPSESSSVTFPHSGPMMHCPSEQILQPVHKPTFRLKSLQSLSLVTQSPSWSAIVGLHPAPPPPPPPPPPPSPSGPPGGCSGPGGGSGCCPFSTTSNKLNEGMVITSRPLA